MPSRQIQLNVDVPLHLPMPTTCCVCALVNVVIVVQVTEYIAWHSREREIERLLSVPAAIEGTRWWATMGRR